MPAFGAGLDALGKFARAIIEGIGIIGLGIIVFTLVLKAITLPFDIYQRYKMRKQTLIMRNMKDDLDKLQKQYANDKATYQMKMQELYKKNGYSMLGACLPMILSIVILIVAFQGFNTYSRYATVEIFQGMAKEYNEVILGHGMDGIDYTLPVSSENEAQEGEAANVLPQMEGSWKSDDGLTLYEIERVDDILYLRVSPVEDRAENADKFMVYRYSLGSYEEKEGSETLIPAAEVVREYQVSAARLKEYLTAEAAGQAEEQTPEKEYLSLLETAQAEEDEAGVRYACTGYLVKIGALAARESYFEHRPSFLWVKNVWYSDVSYNHPVPAKTVSASLDQVLYDNLTSELASEKKAANGYYILIILSIASMALSQFITMRSQKESNKYQSVDGQGAFMQKAMLVIMPLIFAIFSFFYSAAFSIYMIMSSLISLLVTVVCNLVLGRIFRKKEEAEIKAQYGRSVPWKKDREEQSRGQKKRK